jgi:NitT/TauT family transport system substrate-binding protein
MPSTSRRTFVQLLGVGGVGLLAAACASGSTPAASPTSAPAAQPTTPPATAATSAAAPKPAATQAPVTTRPPATVRITDIQITSAAGSYIAAERGYFREEGIQAQFIPVPTADQITAIVSDSADVAGAAINAQLYNALARGLPLKMMADHGANLMGASAGGVVFRKDLFDSGQIKGPADLKGLKVGTGQPPGTSTADIAFSHYLEQGGLTEKDVDMTVLAFPDILTAFVSHNIQAAYWQEPFTTIAVKQGAVVRGPIGFELYPLQQIAVLVFGRTIQADRDLSLRYLRAYTRGIRDYVKGLISKDQPTFEQVAPILIQHTTVKDISLLQDAIPSGLKADPVPNQQSIVDDLDWFVEHGQVTQKYDVTQYIDVGTVQEAIQQVGPA